MATLDPTIPFTYGTNIPLIDSRTLVVFQDLTNHIESHSDDEIVQSAIIQCSPCTETQRDYIMAFYVTNKNLSFQWVNPHDDETYTLYFLSPPPTPIRIPSMVGHWTINLSVTGTRNA